MSDGLLLRFPGDTKPLGTRSHDVGDIIAAVEDAVVAVVLKQHPGAKLDKIPVSLVRIEHESVGLVFASPVNEVVLPAALYLTSAIQRERWNELPLNALSSLRKIQRAAKRIDSSAVFRVEHGAETATAVLSPLTNIPESVVIFGETVLYGEVKRVGGVDPKVEIKPFTGDTLYCSTTAEIARQLGPYLYEQVAVYGAAEWNAETLEVENFDISRVMPREKVSPEEAFARLRNSYGKYFDRIDDPDRWVDELRHGE